MDSIVGVAWSEESPSEDFIGLVFIVDCVKRPGQLSRAAFATLLEWLEDDHTQVLEQVLAIGQDLISEKPDLNPVIIDSHMIVKTRYFR